MTIETVVEPTLVEQGQGHRPEAAAEAEGSLGNPPADRWPPCAIPLFNLAIESKLGGCDLVRLRVEDVMRGGLVRPRTLICQRKTGVPVQFEITEQTRAAEAAWAASAKLQPRHWLFPSQVDHREPFTARQYARLVDDWISAIGLSVKVHSTHSLRRTKALLISRKPGNIRAVQLLLGHTKVDSTDLDVEVEDALAVAEGIDV